MITSILLHQPSIISVSLKKLNLTMVTPVSQAFSNPLLDR